MEREEREEKEGREEKREGLEEEREEEGEGLGEESQGIRESVMCFFKFSEKFTKKSFKSCSNCANLS